MLKLIYFLQAIILAAIGTTVKGCPDSFAQILSGFATSNDC